MAHNNQVVTRQEYDALRRDMEVLRDYVGVLQDRVSSLLAAQNHGPPGQPFPFQPVRPMGSNFENQSLPFLGLGAQEVKPSPLDPNFPSPQYQTNPFQPYQTNPFPPHQAPSSYPSFPCQAPPIQNPPCPPKAPQKLPPANSQNQPKHQHKAREYTPIAIPMTEVLNRLLSVGLITLVPVKEPPNPLPPTFRADAHCAYHSGQRGHDTNECRSLRNKVQDLINAKVIQWEEIGMPSDPLPNHQVGMVSEKEEAPKFHPQPLIGSPGTTVSYSQET